MKKTTTLWIQRGVWTTALLLLGLLLSTCGSAGAGDGSKAPGNDGEQPGGTPGNGGRQTGGTPGNDGRQPGGGQPDPCATEQDQGFTIITNRGELESMSDNLDARYCLTVDIDLAGKNWTPLAAFTGTFVGEGKTIKGLTIEERGTDTVGFFSELGAGASVKNLIFDAPNVKGKNHTGVLAGKSNKTGDTPAVIDKIRITGASVTGTSFVGGLVGSNYGAITTSFAGGTVTSTSYVGGLVGYNSGSTIEKSYATAAVTGTGTVVGGLVGYNLASTITNSYAKGAVTGTNEVGGLVGYNSGSTIEKSYATGAVTRIGTRSKIYLGGLVGYNHTNATVTNSYYDKASTKQKDTGKGLGVSAALNIKQVNSEYYDRVDSTKPVQIFIDWDFDTIWVFAEGAWPTLEWQNQ